MTARSHFKIMTVNLNDYNFQGLFKLNGMLKINLESLKIRRYHDNNFINSDKQFNLLLVTKLTRNKHNSKFATRF